MDQKHLSPSTMNKFLALTLLLASACSNQGFRLSGPLPPGTSVSRPNGGSAFRYMGPVAVGNSHAHASAAVNIFNLPVSTIDLLRKAHLAYEGHFYHEDRALQAAAERAAAAAWANYDKQTANLDSLNLIKQMHTFILCSDPSPTKVDFFLRAHDRPASVPVPSIQECQELIHRDQPISSPESVLQAAVNNESTQQLLLALLANAKSNSAAAAEFSPPQRTTKATEEDTPLSRQIRSLIAAGLFAFRSLSSIFSFASTYQLRGQVKDLRRNVHTIAQTTAALTETDKLLMERLTALAHHLAEAEAKAALTAAFHEASVFIALGTQELDAITTAAHSNTFRPAIIASHHANTLMAELHAASAQEGYRVIPSSVADLTLCKASYLATKFGELHMFIHVPITQDNRHLHLYEFSTIPVLTAAGWLAYNPESTFLAVQENPSGSYTALNHHDINDRCTAFSNEWHCNAPAILYKEGHGHSNGPINHATALSTDQELKNRNDASCLFGLRLHRQQLAKDSCAVRKIGAGSFAKSVGHNTFVVFSPDNPILRLRCNSTEIVISDITDAVQVQLSPRCSLESSWLDLRASHNFHTITAATPNIAGYHDYLGSLSTLPASDVEEAIAQTDVTYRNHLKARQEALDRHDSLIKGPTFGVNINFASVIVAVLIVLALLAAAFLVHQGGFFQDCTARLADCAPDAVCTQSTATDNDNSYSQVHHRAHTDRVLFGKELPRPPLYPKMPKADPTPSPESRDIYCNNGPTAPTATAPAPAP